ncbi:M6 family metalloprotease domain-containing protein [Gynuella sp.]|uniref:M6 family metalloprotease domain-containing protein n=1 Tax=Gynuella sp. TaxID=2969146 RepID=UPI003D0E846E
MSSVVRFSIILMVLVASLPSLAVVPAVNDALSERSTPVWTSNQVELLGRSSLVRSTSNSIPSQVPLMMVMVDFSNQAFSTAQSDWQQTMFGEEGSVSSYYQWTSNNRFSFIDAGSRHVSLGMNHPDSGSDFAAAKTLIKTALAALSSSVDFSLYDSNSDGRVSAQELALVFVVAGYENAYGGASAPRPNIWAHQSYAGVTSDGVTLGSYVVVGELHGNHSATIGIIAHELGHLVFNLPDLYDRDGSSQGIGSWGLMGAGVWNTAHGKLGDSPARMLAWSREQTGFGDEVSADDADKNILLQPGQYVKIRLSSYEALYLEQRDDSSFDAGLPGSGMLISHVDNRKNNNDDEAHKLIDIESADGMFDLDNNRNSGDAGDPFPGEELVYEFGPDSTPSSLTYDGEDLGVRVYFGPNADFSFSQNVRSSTDDQSASGSFSVFPGVLVVVLVIGYRTGGRSRHV